MRFVVAFAVVALTVVCCLAVSHGLDLQYGREVQRTGELAAELERLRGSTPGVRLEELKEREQRLSSCLKRLSSRNDGLSLLLAAVDGPGTRLRELHLDRGEVLIVLSGDAPDTLARLRRLPGGQAWALGEKNRLKGKVSP